MLKVAEVAFVGYPVTDVARARAFYEGVLNLTLTRDYEHDGKHWLEYDIGTTTLAISDLAPQWKPSADGPSIALELEDFDAGVAAARKAGVPFVSEVVVTPACRFVVIQDPDGNSLTLHKRDRT